MIDRPLAPAHRGAVTGGPAGFPATAVREPSR